MSTETQPTAPVEPTIRIREVMKITGLGKTTIYRRIENKTFPSGIVVDGLAYWLQSDVDNWRLVNIVEPLQRKKEAEMAQGAGS